MFQKLYDFFRNIRTPAWLRDVLGEIQEIILSILYQVGKEYLTRLEEEIIKVAQMDMSNEAKFKTVFTYARTMGIELKDSALRLLIEALVNRLKDYKVI